MKLIIRTIFIFILFISTTSCSTQGIAVTTDGQTLKDAIKIDDVLPGRQHKKRYDLRITTTDKGKKKIHDFLADGIKYAVINPGRKDSVMYRSLTVDAGISLCRCVKAKGNAGIYLFTWTEYLPYSGTDGPDDVNNGGYYLLVSNNNVVKIEMPVPENKLKVNKKRGKYKSIKWLYAPPSLKMVVTYFINDRYNQHFKRGDFKNVNSLFDYILNKETGNK